jgi:hypothetical protein
LTDYNKNPFATIQASAKAGEYLLHVTMVQEAVACFFRQREEPCLNIGLSKKWPLEEMTPVPKLLTKGLAMAYECKLFCHRPEEQQQIRESLNSGHNTKHRA